jgi:hypothetical protein
VLVVDVVTVTGVDVLVVETSTVVLVVDAIVVEVVLVEVATVVEVVELGGSVAVVLVVETTAVEVVVLVLVVEVVLLVVVLLASVEVVVHCGGAHASAQVANAAQPPPGSNVSAHLSAGRTAQVTAPFAFVVRQSTEPGRPHSALTSAFLTSF